MNRSEKLLEIVMRNLPGTFYLFDEQGEIKEWNRKVEEITGYRGNKINELNLVDFFDKNDHEKIRKAILRGFEKGGTEIEADFLTKHGEKIPVHFSACRLEIDGMPYLAAIGIDISRQKEVERELQKQKKLLRAIMQQSGSIIYVKDVGGSYRMVNDKFCEHLDITKEEAEGLRDRDLFDEKDAERILHEDKEILKSGEPKSYEETLAADGETRHFSITKYPLRDIEGFEESLCGIINDITEQKLADQKLKELNKTLDLRVKKRTSQLEKANQELESFSYSVSHDLRSPLRAVGGYTKLLLEDHYENLNDEGKEFLEIIREETKRMGDLIDNLLEFSKLSRMEKSYQLFSMSDLVNECLREAKRSHPGLSPSIHLEKLPDVRADRNQIIHIWRNLIENAMKFRKPGTQPEITIEGRKDEQHERVVYTITDKGVGFDMKYADKLFGVFQRLHSMDEFEGTGIGLALVQRIIRRHDGEVWAESEPGEGATFCFALPLEPKYQGKEVKIYD